MQIVRIGDGSAKHYSADVVGGKAANLATMAALGLPVPPAFVLPIELCAAVVRGDPDAKKKLNDGLSEGIEFLQATTGKGFGDRRRPLLVSVRSGAARSMPGMLDTVIDVGCTAATVYGLMRTTGDPHFAHDCRRRFLESYGSVVFGIDSGAFAVRLKDMAAAEGVESERELDCEALERLAQSFQELIEDERGSLPENPMDDLRTAAEAVYRSWTGDRARSYRTLQHLEDLQGTAVTIQAMVFGNYGDRSGAGVAFSRDPSTGAPEPVIDILFGGQGEDVVSGRRNPETGESIARTLPEVDAQLRRALRQLEQEFRDVQDVEFTIENGKLWFLQTRSAKRTPQAAVRIAIDLVKEQQLTPQEGLQRLNGINLHELVRRRLVNAGNVIAHGTGASAGVAAGRAAFDAESAARLAASGEPIILLRPEINTADVSGFAVSAGIVTATGGRTAHAALVARQMGKPCIVGCLALAIDPQHHNATLATNKINEGDWLSIDATEGNIYLGRANVVTERPDAEWEEIERWKKGASAVA